MNDLVSDLFESPIGLYQSLNKGLGNIIIHLKYIKVSNSASKTTCRLAAAFEP